MLLLNDYTENDSHVQYECHETELNSRSKYMENHHLKASLEKHVPRVLGGFPIIDVPVQWIISSCIRVESTDVI